MKYVRIQGHLHSLEEKKLKQMSEISMEFGYAYQFMKHAPILTRNIIKKNKKMILTVIGTSDERNKLASICAHMSIEFDAN